MVSLVTNSQASTKCIQLPLLTKEISIKLSQRMTKPTTKWHVRPVKTQISLGIRLVWSESSLCYLWVAKDTSFLHAYSEDSDKTGRIPRLIWVFAGRTCHFVGFVMRWLRAHDKTYPQHDLCNQQIHRSACTFIQYGMGSRSSFIG